MPSKEEGRAEAGTPKSEPPTPLPISAEVDLNRTAIQERMDFLAEAFDDPRSAFRVMEDYARAKVGEPAPHQCGEDQRGPQPAHEARGETTMIVSGQPDASTLRAAQGEIEAQRISTQEGEGGRLEIELSGHAVDFMSDLMRDTGDSPGELLRKALGLYRLAVDAWKENKSVGAAADSDALEIEYVGP